MHQRIRPDRPHQEDAAYRKLVDEHFDSARYWASIAFQDWYDFPSMSREERNVASTVAWYNLDRAEQAFDSMADLLAKQVPLKRHQT